MINTTVISLDTSITISPKKKNGGVRFTNGSLHLFGALKVIYRIRDSLHIDRYSYLQIHTRAETVADKTEICFYENDEEATRLDSFINYESRCTAITFQDPTQKISLGEVFNFRNATINYISIKQEDVHSGTESSAKTVLSSLTLIHKDTSQYYQAYDSDCTLFDENSVRLSSEMNHRNMCTCKYGFVSSNKGKMLGKRDACIETIGRRGYDGSVCNFFRECASGNCISGICKSSSQPKVSNHDYDGESLDMNTTSVPIAFTNFSEGGVIIDPDKSLKVYGDTEMLIQLGISIVISKFSTINVNVGRLGTNLSSKICLLNSQEVDIDTVKSYGYSTIEERCPLVCLDFILPSRSENILHLEVNELVKYQDILEIDFILLHQKRNSIAENKHSDEDYMMIQSIDFEHLKPESHIDANGECRDSNSYKVNAKDNITNSTVQSCMCFDGFTSSSGGKKLGINGTCVNCFDQSDNDCFNIYPDEPCTRVSAFFCGKNT